MGKKRKKRLKHPVYLDREQIYRITGKKLLKSLIDIDPNHLLIQPDGDDPDVIPIEPTDIIVVLREITD